MSDLVISSKISANDMAQDMATYQELFKKLLDNNDIATIQGKQYVKKSGWLKLSVPYNISTSIVEEQVERPIPEDPSKVVYHFRVRAEVPQIRHVEEVGSCDNITDKPNNPIHIIRSMAKTRATSRAIAAIMGKSEQSAEDMESIPPLQGADPKPYSVNPPTAKQIAYLKSLDPNAEVPQSMFECGKLIEELKAK